jgi:hypothetical protein
MPGITGLTVPAAALAVLAVLFGAVPAGAGPDVVEPTAGAYSPPFVDHTDWVRWDRGLSLRVYPTPSARAAARRLGTAGADADEAWDEVLTLAPDAGSPGMREQFRCHWELAEFAQPGKTSWNLEPWRPVVDAAEMVRSGCNPGGGQGPF